MATVNPTKTIVVFFLILGLVVPKVMLSLIVNYPTVISHFNHHNKEHGKMSWIEFFNAHLAESHHHDKEHANHDKLPFNHQHTDDCCKSQNFIPFYSKQAINFQIPIFTELKVITNYFFNSSDYTKNIWQPPKIC